MAINPDLLQGYQDEFTSWVDNQSMSSSIFTCGSDVRIEHPFPEDDRMWALWADQDCSDFDLILTVIMDEQAENNLIGWIGADLADRKCVKADYWSEGVIACDFEIKA